MPKRTPSLPAWLRALFWEHDFTKLAWDRDRDLITAKVLASGDWQSVTWLLRQSSREELRRWIEEREGRGLSPQQLGYWELLLGLPHRRVNSWLQRTEASPGPSSRWG